MYRDSGKRCGGVLDGFAGLIRCQVRHCCIFSVFTYAVTVIQTIFLLLFRALYEKFGFETVKTEDLGNDCELVFMRRVT